MPSICVPLSISKDELLRWYSGEAKDVTAFALDGRSVRFPADVIRPFVMQDGVHGYFEIHFSSEGKFEEMCRVKSNL